MGDAELVFGLIGAIGTDLEMVQEALMRKLKSVGYDAVVIRMSDLLRDTLEADRDSTFPVRSDADYYDRAMTAGNDFRTRLDRADAMAGLAIASISVRRKKDQIAGAQGSKRAFILHSLKRSEEIRLIRSVYGPAAFFISAYAPRGVRVSRLAMLLAQKKFHNRSDEFRPQAEGLVQRDANEPGDLGQDVRKAYPLGDLFVNCSDVTQCEQAVERFVALIFGDPWRSPTREEQGMAFAFLASVRSASPARQVGAAIIDKAGHLVSVGMNEVAKPKGGQYWEGDRNDGRDFKIGRVDLSDQMRQNVLADILRKLKQLDVFKAEVDSAELLKPGSESYKELRSAQLFDTIDFMRSVHAEASSILAAGSRAKNSTLLVTTFPCHECARHIVAAGVTRVFYVEPYPKSLVNELYPDSISVDEEAVSDGKVAFNPFTGISPTVSQHLFPLTKAARKEKDGKLKMWDSSQAVPCLHVFYSEAAVKAAEIEVLAQLKQT